MTWNVLFVPSFDSIYKLFHFNLTSYKRYIFILLYTRRTQTEKAYVLKKSFNAVLAVIYFGLSLHTHSHVTDTAAVKLFTSGLELWWHFFANILFTLRFLPKAKIVFLLYFRETKFNFGQLFANTGKWSFFSQAYWTRGWLTALHLQNTVYIRIHYTLTAV